MTRFSGQFGDEGELCTTVAFPERMDGVEIGQELGGPLDEPVGITISKTVIVGKICESLSHLRPDVLWVPSARWGSALRL